MNNGSNPTRKDAASNSLTIHIDYDTDGAYTTVNTNIKDSVVFTRIMGDAMRVFSDELLRIRAIEAAKRIQLARSPLPPITEH